MDNTEREPNSEPRRPAYRPPLGMPIQDARDGYKGAAASILFHGLLIFLLIFLGRTPPPELIFDEVPTGAGGIDLPAGGGGGGTLGAGGKPTRPERVQFIQVAPTPSTKTTPEPVKVEPIKPTPVPALVKPPEKPVVADLTPPVVETKVIAAAVSGTIDSSLLGRGGGSGNDGTAGNGPGRGGGIGSGDGTGRGSGTGPGTGGGAGNIYIPMPIVAPLIPEAPGKLRPFEVVALFDVDSTGFVRGFTFNKSGDRGYDRAVEATLRAMRFRPAVDLQGRPVRATAQITFASK